MGLLGVFLSGVHGMARNNAGHNQCSGRLCLDGFPPHETVLEAKEFTFRALGLPKWARSFPGARHALP
jgi:hypothetical protein